MISMFSYMTLATYTENELTITKIKQFINIFLFGFKHLIY